MQSLCVEFHQLLPWPFWDVNLSPDSLLSAEIIWFKSGASLGSLCSGTTEIQFSAVVNDTVF